MAIYNKIGNVSQGSACGIIRDNYLFLGCGNRIKIYTINENGLLSYISQSSTFTNGSVGAVQLSGNFLFYNSGYYLEIINISDPYSPVFVGYCLIDGDATSIAVIDSYLYITSNGYSGDLKIVDFSDINNPVLINEYNSPGDISKSIIISEDKALFSYYFQNYGFQILDISNPEQPSLVYNYSSPSLPACTVDIALNNNNLYFSEYDAMLSFDITNCSSPILIDEFFPIEPINLYTISNSQLFARVVGAGFISLDISDPYNISQSAKYHSNNTINSILVKDNIAYVLQQYDIQVIDISDIYEPEYIYNYQTNNEEYEIEIKENYLYTTGNYSRIHIYDFSGSNNISYVGESNFNSKAFLLDNFGYSQCGKVIDFTDPIDFEVISTFQAHEYSNNIAKFGNTIGISYYFCDDWNPNETGIQFFEVTLPNQPQLLGSYDIMSDSNKILSLDIENNYIFYIDSCQDGLYSLNILNPQNPSISDYYEISNPSEIFTTPTNAFISTLDEGLLIFDISDPNNIAFITSILPHPDSRIETKAIVENNLLVLSDNSWNEFSFYNISDINNPDLISLLKFNMISNDVKYIDSKLFCANDIWGITIIDVEDFVGVSNYNFCNPTINTLNNYPNPFNPTTTIEFSITQKTQIELSIFNIKGQKVNTLLTAELEKGTYTTVWNGNNELGKPVSSGIYYCKLNVNGKTEAVHKCLLLK